MMSFLIINMHNMSESSLLPVWQCEIHCQDIILLDHVYITAVSDHVFWQHFSSRGY